MVRQKQISNSYLFTTILLLVLASLISLWHLSISGMNLFFDEAQYWSWAKTPAFGYYSKPPMVAWLIAATTSVCGDGEACVRVSSLIMHFCTGIVIYNIANTLYNSEKGFYSAITYITMPAVVLSSSLVSTDPALLFFYSLALFFFIKATKENTWFWWICAGIAAGAGMLSKYNMLIFLVSAVFYLFFQEQYRKYLFSLKFWIAALVALLIFLPNVFWNLHNGMASFAHTSDNARGNGIALHPLKMLEFLGAQFGVFGPILFGGLLTILFKIKSNFYYNEERLLLWFILPLLVLITSISLLSRAHANWAAPIYVPATILVSSWLIDKQKKKLLLASLFLHIFVAAIFINFKFIVQIPGIHLSARTTNLKQGIIKDPFYRLAGWKELGDSVLLLSKSYPDTILLTEERKIHAELLYYARPFSKTAKKWNPDHKTKDHYDLTASLNDSAKGKDFIFVTSRVSVENSIALYFDENMRIGNVEINPHKDKPINYYIYYLKGFKGYDAG